MKTMISSALPVLALSMLVLGPTVTAGESATSAASNTPEPKAETKKDAETCPVMMEGSGATEDGKKAMQEFMHSPRGAQAMTNMMEMARRMGNGDAMLGMTKMMEMMGGQGGMGGMMDGQSGPTAQPK